LQRRLRHRPSPDTAAGQVAPATHPQRDQNDASSAFYVGRKGGSGYSLRVVLAATVAHPMSTPKRRRFDPENLKFICFRSHTHVVAAQLNIKTAIDVTGMINFLFMDAP
jgi:hypothetical protein